MKIEIEVPDIELGQSVAAMVAQLSPDDQKELAREVIRGWLQSPDLERATREDEVAREIAANGRVYNLDAARKSDYFVQSMRGWRSTRERILLSIADSMNKAMVAAVVEWVRADETVAQVRAAAVASVRDTFPQIVLSVVTSWFLGGVEAMARGAKHIPSLRDHLAQIRGDLTDTFFSRE